jgi:hypothetical protein
MQDFAQDIYFEQVLDLFLSSSPGSSHHSENRLHLAGSGSGSESASDGLVPSNLHRQQQQQHLANRHNQALSRDALGEFNKSRPLLSG